MSSSSVVRAAAVSRRLPTIPETAAPRSGLQPIQKKSTQKLTNPAAKAQRTSKTSQKLVVLPSEPQKKPFPLPDEEVISEIAEDVALEDRRSPGERMNKEQRKKAGYKRLTAYCIADGIKTKATAAFLKREHGVSPRVFDEAIYVVSLHTFNYVKIIEVSRCTICRYFQVMYQTSTSALQ